MKKLMFAVVAMACVGLNAEITSSNVVGYQQQASVAGFNFVAPTFLTVGKDTVNIQDIKLVSGTISEYTDNIQILDEGGATTHVYLWVTAENSPTGVAGWLSEDWSSLADVTLPAGVSVLVSTENADVMLQYAGSVKDSATVVSSVAGFNFVGNNSPVEINIQGFQLSGTISEYTDNIQILDEGGATTHVYLWVTAENSPTGVAGWLSEDWSSLADVKIPAGMGILIATENAGVNITIPSAL